MSNALPIAWRSSCPLGLRASARPLAAPSLRKSIVSLQKDTFSTFSFPTHRIQSWTKIPWRQATHSSCPVGLTIGLLPGTIFQRSAKTTAKPTNVPSEHGVKLDNQPLSAAEINAIFNSRKITPEMGNRIVSVLQGRRETGTLDLPFPTDISRAVRPKTIENGLHWLRKEYPMDEDAAIMARIEREEREEEERLYQHVKEQGLHHPQSGRWGARFGKGQDIRGESVFQKIREKNEARILAEDEKEREEWLEGEAAEQAKMQKHLKKNTELQKYNEAAVVEGKI